MNAKSPLSLIVCLSIVSCIVSVLASKVSAPAGNYNGLTVAFQENSVDQFLGIPYASKPERFRPPVAHPPVSNFNATQQPPGCIQANIGRRSKLAPDTTAPIQSEDCLKLNLYRPSAPPPAGGYAVMFWVHGGTFAVGYIGGTSDLNTFDGTSFAATQDVIIVEANYRLTVFGFPGGDEVLGLKERNLGIRDIQLALKWVQDNIEAFGGDKTKVTAFGSSAGAAILDEIGLTKGRSLFRAVILQSSTSILLQIANLATRHLPFQIKPWNALASALKCPANDVFGCLQKVDPFNISSSVIEQKLLFAPVFDGGATIARGSHQTRTNIPTLIGHVYQDGLESDDTAILGTVVSALFPGAYPIGPGQEFPNATYAYGGFGTDALFNCPATRVALNTSMRGTAPVYRFVYNASFPNMRWTYVPGVSHGTEVAIVWGNLPPASTSDELGLSRLMQTWWANFAKTLNPGVGWAPLVGAGSDNQLLNSITIDSVRTAQPVVRPLMSRYGGSARCFPEFDRVYDNIDAGSW